MSFAQGLGRRGALLGTLALAGCQQPGGLNADATNAPVRLGPDGTGYILVNAPLVSEVRDAFITDVNKLLALKAQQVYLYLASPGGVVDVAQDMIAFMDRTHAERGTRFITHNVGAVASAACYVFLAGQRRLSVPGGAFLFHEASLVASGPLTSYRLQEESKRVQSIDRAFLTMLTTRTRLTEAEASSFTRRTVILSADEARRDGVIDEIAAIPKVTGASIFVIRRVQNAPGAPRSPLPSG